MGTARACDSRVPGGSPHRAVGRAGPRAWEICLFVQRPCTVPRSLSVPSEGTACAGASPRSVAQTDLGPHRELRQ